MGNAPPGSIKIPQALRIFWANSEQILPTSCPGAVEEKTLKKILGECAGGVGKPIDERPRVPTVWAHSKRGPTRFGCPVQRQMTPKLGDGKYTCFARNRASK